MQGKGGNFSFSFPGANVLQRFCMGIFSIPPAAVPGTPALNYTLRTKADDPDGFMGQGPKSDTKNRAELIKVS